MMQLSIQRLRRPGQAHTARPRRFSLDSNRDVKPRVIPRGIFEGVGGGPWGLVLPFAWHTYLIRQKARLAPRDIWTENNHKSRDTCPRPGGISG